MHRKISSNGHLHDFRLRLAFFPRSSVGFIHKNSDASFSLIYCFLRAKFQERRHAHCGRDDEKVATRASRKRPLSCTSVLSEL